jgi:hypothetical protein
MLMYLPVFSVSIRAFKEWKDEQRLSSLGELMNSSFNPK